MQPLPTPAKISTKLLTSNLSPTEVIPIHLLLLDKSFRGLTVSKGSLDIA